MKMTSLTIKNFRCFENIKIDFDKKLTVLVGKNGSGKTSVLDVIAVLFSYISGFNSMADEDYSFSKHDIRNPLESNDIIVSTKFFSPHCTRDIVFKFDKFIEDKNLLCTNDIDKYIRISDEFRKLDDSYSKARNTFIYYNSKRNIINTKDNDSEERHNFRDYLDLFTPNIDYSASVRWFDAKDAEEARRRSRNPQENYRDPVLTAVRTAIERALPGNNYVFPHMDGTPPEFFITHNESGREVKVTHLSDGYKVMLALVMDLARRMAVIGKNSPTPPLEAPGIVLIDEIELHLHPAWQQTVLPSLMEIFPNIQFIVSTHSPQIVTSVKPENVVILQDGMVKDVEISTYGAETSPVLQDIFGVSLRPPNNATEALGKYLGLIDAGNGTSNKALELREKLESLMPGDPILAVADRMILREERRRERMGKSHA